MPFTTRMIVIRLRDGSLWINSPLVSSEDDADELRRLGPVRYLVSPTPLHSWRVKDSAKFFPDAECWGPPSVRNNRGEFPHTLNDRPPLGWSDDLDQLVFRGSFVSNEVYFLHMASRTAILGDFIQRYPMRPGNRLYNTSMKMLGVLNGGVPIDVKLTFAGGFARGRASLAKLLAWDFDKLILAHGDCVEHDAKTFVSRAFSFLA